MAKAIRTPAKVKEMNADFKHILTTLEDIAGGTEELMPLFSASLKLSTRILREYQKAYNAGTAYVIK